MVVFLTSSPCDDNVPSGVKMPCILDCRNGFVDNMRSWWKPQSVGVIIAAYPCNFALNDEMRDTFGQIKKDEEITNKSMEVWKTWDSLM